MGFNYYSKGRIISLVKYGRTLYGVVVGKATYRTILDIESGNGSCTCPRGYNCKHVMALKHAFERGDYVEVDSSLKAILSLLSTFKES